MSLYDKTPYELNDDFLYALDTMEKTNRHCFITGRAGSGKSTLLQLFKNTTNKTVVTLAPTGIAALNVQGQTIHSFFGFPAKPITKADIKPRRNKKLFKKIDTIIIDEISMVRADMIDNMDYFMRVNGRDSSLPFGGAQMVMFGDLFQLPPIISNEEEGQLFQQLYDSPYFFSAHIFKTTDFETIELHKVYRQKQKHFLKLLEAVRLNHIDFDVLEDLNERVQPVDHNDIHITIATRNAIVNGINLKKLNRLGGEEYSFSASISGSFSERAAPAELILKLKEDAQVMFTKNDPEGKYVNGTLGRIKVVNLDQILVETVDDFGLRKSINVEREQWEILKYKLNEKNEIEAEVVGSFKQYPLKLAWAITIHKSQGKTFDKVVIDLGTGAFEHGQTYVALSRCRTFEGITLRQPIRMRDILTDERIVQFYEMNR